LINIFLYLDSLFILPKFSGDSNQCCAETAQSAAAFTTCVLGRRAKGCFCHWNPLYSGAWAL